MNFDKYVNLSGINQKQEEEILLSAFVKPKDATQIFVVVAKRANDKKFAAHHISVGHI